MNPITHDYDSILELCGKLGYIFQFVTNVHSF